MHRTSERDRIGQTPGPAVDSSKLLQVFRTIEIRIIVVEERLHIHITVARSYMGPDEPFFPQPLQREAHFGGGSS